jgi:hypothetical protein
MKPEVNAVLQEVKQALANPQPKIEGQAQPVDINSLRLPDFSTLSIMEATKWCMEHGITKAPDIAHLTGKQVNTIHTAQWKLRNPKRVKVLQRRAKKAKAKAKDREVKIMLIKDATKGKTVKTTKPKITNGRYDDGMETPYLDALNRATQRFNFLDEEKQPMHELVAENRRLKILVEHYETLLFKGGK